MKSIVIATALLLAACAPTRESTYAAHGADIVTTGVGLAMGAAEANPLGVIGIPIKIAITEHVKTLPKDEQPQAYAALSAVTWGVVGNNVCVILSMATAGSFGPICPVIGIVTGVSYWDKAKDLIPRSVACFQPGSEGADEFPNFVCKSEDS